MKIGTEQDYDILLYEFLEKEDLEPVLAKLYDILWGPLPEGRSPIIEYVRCWPAGQPSYRRQDWLDLRESLYGPPPYDYEKLRAIALEP